MSEQLESLVETNIIKSIVYNTLENLCGKRMYRENGNKDACEFVITKRYSELYAFHKRLYEELKPYLKKNKFPLSDFPIFPAKTFLTYTDFDFISRRIAGFNTYF